MTISPPAAFSIAIWLGASITGADDVDDAQYWGILGVVLVLAVGFVLAAMVKNPPKGDRVLG